MRCGFDVFDTISGPVSGFLVVNPSATSCSLEILNGSGVHSSVPAITNLDIIPALTGTSHFEFNAGPATTITVPAFSTRFIYYSVKVKASGPGNPGTHAWNFSLTVKEDGGSPRVVNFGRSVLIVASASSSSLAGTGIGLAGSGISMASPQSGTTTGSTVCWGTINVHAVPPSGSVTVTGFKGNFIAQLFIGGVLKSSYDYVPTPWNDWGEVAPGSLTFSTSSPSTFIGQDIQVYVNDVLCYTQEIEADENGNFDYDISASAWEYPMLHREEPGDTPVPQPNDPYTTGVPASGGGTENPVTNPNDPDHDRPSPGPVPGPDPATDPTVDSDGEGPGEGLSVEDMYRAVRAGVEDANRVPTENVPGFDWEEFLGDDTATDEGSKETAEGVGAGFSGLQMDAGTMIGVPSVTGGLPLFVSVAGWNVEIPRLPAAGASLIRTVLLIFLAIFTLIGAIGIVRSSSAGA